MDEFTLVLQYKNGSIIKNECDWDYIANKIIDIFASKLDLEQILGKKEVEKTAPLGYKVAYKYGQHDFYFSIAYHPLHRNMGICVKFSAQSLGYYTRESNLAIYEIIKISESGNYTIRLSRVDLTVDYIDYDIDISKLYFDYVNKKVLIYQELEDKNGHNILRLCNLKCSGIISEEKINTLYIGSNQSKVRLRVYDKKLEQLQKKGNYLDRAIQCESWVRFEVVFKSDFAHQITDKLLVIKNQNELINLIASLICQKFTFYHEESKEVMGFSQELKRLVLNKSKKIKSAKVNNYSLISDLVYHNKNSGLMSLMYKIQSIWGEKGLIEMQQYFFHQSNFYIINNDCKDWLNKNKEQHKENYESFNAYVEKNKKIINYLMKV